MIDRASGKPSATEPRCEAPEDTRPPPSAMTVAHELCECLERHTAARFPSGRGGGRRRCRSWGRISVGGKLAGFRIGDEFLHLLPGAKRHYTSFWHRDLFACSRVSTDARSAGLDFKHAEITQFPALSVGQRAGDGVKGTFDDLSDVALGHAQHIRHPDHQFAFCHCHRARPSFH